MTYRELYETGKRTLTEAAILESDLDARLLLEFVCQTNRNDLLVHGDREITKEQESSYLELLQKRAAHFPLQYLTGVQEFMGLEFFVNEHVLIPRQDTELLVEEVMRHTHDGMRILDMCTGSGCILLSLLHYSNNCQGMGVDISKEALEVASMNARKLLGEECFADSLPEETGDGKQVTLVESDLFENVRGMFDLLVSNPPYIQTKVIETLMPEVRDFEPRGALDGSEDGLEFYKRITTQCQTHLKKGGMLFFEIGYDQAEKVKQLMEQNGFLEVHVIKDFSGLDRVVYGTLRF